MDCNCNCYETKLLCENHLNCKCEPLKFEQSNILDLYIPVVFDITHLINSEELVVGHSYNDLDNQCCEWLNTCYLKNKGYDPITELFCMEDKAGNLFYYNEDYILASS